jgi:uncharacterized membrane protein
MMEYLNFAFRWTHVTSALIWVGLLYFFNWVNGPFLASLDAERKRQVIVGLMPRALWWFRWAAAWAWVSGLLVIGLVFYHSRSLMFVPGEDGMPHWSMLAGLVVLLTFTGHHLYDVLAKTVLKDLRAAFVGGLLLSTAYYLFAREVGGFTFRSALIHLGALFGTLMAFNVWFRIWPAQKKVIAAARAGEALPADAAALAAQRSRHNAYMSVPLLMAMSNQHAWMFDGKDLWAVPLLVLIGFLVAHLLFRKSAKLQFNG